MKTILTFASASLRWPRRPEGLVLSLLAALMLFLTSCRKEVFTESPDARLNFSVDTLHFDTVFTSIGTATHNFKVINPNDKAVRVDIQLAGGSASAYRLNIDGHATTALSDYELSANDSMYIFVEATIDPNSTATPFIVSDSILFNTNGNEQKVILTAYGQNAVFYNGEILPCNITWDHTLPIVIYNSVLVPAGCRLTINKGTKVYSYKNSGILVQGTMEINGTPEEPVQFMGHRLEQRYEDEPGQWYGIRFLPKSQNNIIRNARLKNGVIGIEVDSLPITPGGTNLTIENTEISHMSGLGMVGYTSTISATNLLIHTCGLYLFAGDLGGDYTFRHCTFNSGSRLFTQPYPSVLLTNRPLQEKPPYTVNNLTFRFMNCIITGNAEKEVQLAYYSPDNGGGTVGLLLTKNIIKINPNEGWLKTDPDFQQNNYVNVAPEFENVDENNFKLRPSSPAINKGLILNPPVPIDFEGDPRTDGQPDLGCYEAQ